MPSWFLLGLDTTAPSVQLGAVAGSTAGELLRLAYTTDEPLDTASLRLADGRVLSVEVLAAELHVQLPPDTPDGPATLSWADDVGNAASATVVLSGTVVLPPTPVAPAPRQVPGRARGHRVQVSTPITCVSTTRTQVGLGARTRVRTSSTVRVAERVITHPGEKRAVAARVAARSSTRVRSDLHFTTAIRTQVTDEVHRRDDEGLIALLLA